MRRPIVCRSPVGSLWLLLAEETLDGWTTSTWLNLETSEVRDMQRGLASLVNRGWRIVEGDAEWEALK